MILCMIKTFNILFIDCCYAYVKLAIVIGRVRVQIYQSVCLSVSVCLYLDRLFDFDIQSQVHMLMTLLFARTDVYLKNPSICTSRICMRINYLSVCLISLLNTKSKILPEHYR